MDTYNYMENIVKEVLDTIFIKREDVCKCEQCKLDIITWSLNHLTSKYIATPKGKAYARIQGVDLQLKADALKAVLKAIDIVKDKPRH